MYWTRSLILMALAACLLGAPLAAQQSGEDSEPAWIEHANTWTQRSIDDHTIRNHRFEIDRIYPIDSPATETQRLDMTITFAGQTPLMITLVEGVPQVVGNFIIYVSWADPDSATVQSGSALFSLLDLESYRALQEIGRNPADDFVLRTYSIKNIDGEIFGDMLERKLKIYTLFDATGDRQRVSERRYYDRDLGAFIVEAKPQTHESIETLIEQLSAVTAARPAQSATPAADTVPERYRIEVLLLQSGATQSTGEVAKLAFSRDETLQELNCEVGQVVEKGEVLARLDTSDLHYDIQQTQSRLESALAQHKLQESIVDTLKQQVEAGRTTQIELNEKMIELRKTQEKANELEYQIERIEIFANNFTLTAPFDGRVTKIHCYPGQRAKGTILELAKIDPENPARETYPAAELLEKYGLTEDAFLPFEMDELTLSNKTVLELFPDGNKSAGTIMSQTHVSLKYVGFQPPFLITNLQFDSSDNNSYSSDVLLQPNKAGIVGFTNLDDATVMVLYWRKAEE